MPEPVASGEGTLDTKNDDLKVLEELDGTIRDAEFDAAFKEAQGESVKKVDAELNPAEPIPGEVVPSVVESKPAEPAKPAEVPIPPVPGEKPGETEEDFKQKYLTLQGIHKHDREQARIEKEELQSQLEVAKKPVPPTPTPVVEKSPEDIESARAAFIAALTPEQQEALKTYEQEFDVVSKMEGLKREVELKALRKEFQSDLQKWKDEMTSNLTTSLETINTKIAPVIQLETDVDKARHFDVIRQEHSDFETYRDDGTIMKWIESKPRYMQESLRKTYEQGAAEDVVDLITDFKRENNITIEQPSENTNIVDIKNKRDEKKQNLRTVGGRKVAVSASHSVADDFEGAFDEALNK